jgi:hypothetical protein
MDRKPPKPDLGGHSGKMTHQLSLPAHVVGQRNSSRRLVDDLSFSYANHVTRGPDTAKHLVTTAGDEADPVHPKS